MPQTTNNTVERQPKEGYNSLAKVIVETKGKRQMLTYDTLIEEALEALPLFRERYERETAAGMIDTDDGKHIIFTPMLEELIRNNTQPELQKALDFLEKMASSEDGRVVEVCDQSVLEVLNGEFPDEQLRELLGKETIKGFNAVKTYMW